MVAVVAQGPAGDPELLGHVVPALPCRERAGLTILAVNYKEPPAKIHQFLQTLPFSLPILLDPEGDATSNWTPRVFPTSVLIGRDGLPRQSVIGELDWMDGTARELIEPLLVRAKAA